MEDHPSFQVPDSPEGLTQDQRAGLEPPAAWRQTAIQTRQMFIALAQAGFSETEIGRIAAPIGLPIQAVSPAEIAVSILAQIIAAQRTPRSGAAA